MKKISKSQEELAKRLAVEEKKKNENVIKANAFYINFNAPQAGYYKVRTRIASR